MLVEQIQYRPNMYSDTKTYRDWSKYLGEKPTMLANVVRQMPQHSMLYMMLGMGNKFTDKDFTGLKGATGLETQWYQWYIIGHVNQLMYFQESCIPPTTGGTEFKIILDRKYATKKDTLRLKDSNELYVTKLPRRVSDDRWEYSVVVIGNAPSKLNERDERVITDISLLQKGQVIQWSGNLGSEGDTGIDNLKVEGGYEMHRNNMTQTNVRESSTGTFQRMAHYRVKMKKQGQDGVTDLGYEEFIMPDSFKMAQEQLVQQMNERIVFGRGNTNSDGYSSLISDEDFPIPACSGIIEQVERRAPKIPYTILTEKILQDAINIVAENSGQPTGNFLKFVCTKKMWYSVQRVMSTISKAFPITNNEGIFIATNRYGEKTRIADPTQMKGKEFKTNPDIKGIGNVSVGTTFRSYEFAGNVVTFMVDASLSNNINYADREYGIFLNDALADGTPNLQLFTQKGLELLVTEVNGAGGQNGMTSGVASSDGDYRYKTLRAWYSVAVKDPYRALILEQARVA
jgi:hypothetical protein